MVSGRMLRFFICSSERAARAGIIARARAISSAGSGAAVRVALKASTSRPRPNDRRRRMMRHPVACDVDAAANPHLLVVKHVVEEAGEPGGPAGATDQAVVQGERHHSWLALTLAVQ